MILMKQKTWENQKDAKGKWEIDTYIYYIYIDIDKQLLLFFNLSKKIYNFEDH